LIKCRDIRKRKTEGENSITSREKEKSGREGQGSKERPYNRVKGKEWKDEKNSVSTIEEG